jgi:predicted metal-binding protein
VADLDAGFLGAAEACCGRMSGRLPTDETLAEWTAAAREQGLELRAVPISAIVFDARTALKCRYSCPAWGRRWTCDDAGWGPEQLIPLLQRYETVLVLTGTDGARLFAATLALERRACASGFPLALAVSVTPCFTCGTTCTYPGDDCRHRLDLRPESALAGIDSLATLAALGIGTERAEDGRAWLRVSYVFLD